MFIAFEGLDGSGSSTQVEILKNKLNKVLATKEPTNKNIGKIIRSVLQKEISVNPEALQLLFCADRSEHLKNEIIPALNDNKVVITDRYLFSSIAFGSLEINDVDWIKKINSSFMMPDIVFLLKLDPKECIKRIDGRNGKFELFEEEEKLRKIWKTYEKLSDEYLNFYIIDASKTIEEISDKIFSIVEKKLVNK